MKYNSHIVKLFVFLILFCIGYIIYKQTNVYQENFKENSEELIKTSLDQIETRLCDITTYDNFCFRQIINFAGDAERTKTWPGDNLQHSKNIFGGIKARSRELLSIYPSMKNYLQPLMEISDKFIAYTTESRRPALFYEHAYYRGKVATLKPGFYNTSWGNAEGVFKGDTISSLKTNDNTVMVWEHPNKGGKSQTWTPNTNVNWVGKEWNDIISSILIIPRLSYKKLSGSEFIKVRNKYFDELIMLVNKLKKKYNCFGNMNPKSFEHKNLIQKLKQLQGLLVLTEINKTSRQQFNKLLEDIKNILSKSQWFGYGNIKTLNALPGDIKTDLSKLFIQNVNLISESFFKRKGISKKIGNWITFFETKRVPIKGKDYQIINNSSTQTPYLSYFDGLKIVSAGSKNADQEQINLPNFDIKDEGGFNLFRAVVTASNIPKVSTAFSIKESCMKEKDGIPLELGTTPLVLNNFARSSSREEDKNRYSSNGYFGEPQLYIIKNESESGKNLNAEYKTYYLSNSGNNTRVSESKLYKDYNNNPNESKALYHIRAYNPNTGKFDYALDVNSSGNLQPGKLNKTLQTSLYVYKQKGTGYILENYGYRGIGQTAGKPHYFKHSFDNSGREKQELVINESDATIWTFNELTA